MPDAEVAPALIGEQLPPATYGDLASRLMGTEAEQQAVRARIYKSQQAEAAAKAPQIEAARETGERLVRQAEEGRKPVEAAHARLETVRAQQPSLGLRPFLAPINGEAPEASIGKLLQALGLFATTISGAARGDARAGLAAFTGALKGWQEGDKERADRAFADWQTKMDAAVTASEMERQNYRDLMTNANLAWDQRFKAIELTALSYQNERVADVARAQDLKTLEDTLFKHLQHEDEVKKWQATLSQAKATQEQTLLLREQEQERHWKELELREKDLREKAMDRHAALEERAGYHQQWLGMKDTMNMVLLQTPQGRLYWDKDAGEVRPPTRLELAEDEKRRQAGQPTQFTQVINQQVPLIDRLAVAGPVLNALDRLIDRITRAAPGENITQGLIQRLKRTAGIGPDIQQFQTLKLDGVLENAAALSGGQPRISILYMLRGEASPTEFMTTDTAKITNATTRTTIINRLAKITGDPQAFEKLQAGQVEYRLWEGPSPEPTTGVRDPLGIR